MNESDALDAQRVSVQPRAVSWDWEGVPFHYAYSDPVTTHIINTFNMLLPEGEIFFVETFQRALPLITDTVVREDVIGFIGQEATHSDAHQSLLDHLETRGLAGGPYVEQVRWFFRELLGERDDLHGAAAQQWLLERVAVVAAVEHFTSYLGNWGLNASAWSEALDPRVLDLILWHLAEEVEHRHVAFELYQHLDGRYWRRLRSYVAAAPTFILLVARGTRFLCRNDPGAPSTLRGTLRGYISGVRRGVAPGPWSIARATAQYLRPGYHPSRYGSTSQAVAYLASSPAASAARDTAS